MGCDLNRTDDQRQILDAAETMLAAHYPVSRLRARTTDDLGEIAAFGAFALALPEEQGGTGFSVVEEALLHVLLGRHLVGTGALATAVAVRLAMGAGEAALAEGMAQGATKVAAALASGDDLLLLDAGAASHALVIPDTAPALVDIAGLARGAEIGLGHDIAIGRAGADWRTRILARGGADHAHVAALLGAAELLGMAEATRDLSVGYARDRQQFGKPIGSFQAIKHRAADMALRAEMLSAQLDMAAIALRDGSPEAGFQLAALARLAPRVALANARAAVQIHGGMGFSEEAEAQWYVKRAHLVGRLLPPLDLLSVPAPLMPLWKGETA